MMFSALPLQRKAARERGKFQDAASVVRNLQMDCYQHLCLVVETNSQTCSQTFVGDRCC